MAEAIFPTLSDLPIVDTPQMHVYRLRQKIEPNPTRAQILITELEGYRLAR